MDKNNSIEVKKLEKTFWYFKKDFKAIRWIFNRKKYDEQFEVLKGISFSIKKGEAVGIIGKNGAGKSTLLKIISGIYFPTSGEIETTGNISSLIELGSGFSAQYTGRENIYLKGTLLGYSKEHIDSIIDDIIAFADIGKYIDLPFSTYSSGMQARLGFSLAINVDPDILIIDEVFAVGDKNFQNKSRQKTLQFFNMGKTVLFVSHSETLIREFCDRIIYLKDGHIKFDGPVEEGLKVYQEDVAKEYPLPRYFIEHYTETENEIELLVNCGYGNGFNITKDMDLDDVVFVAEKYVDELTQMFIPLEFEINVKIENEKQVRLVIAKENINERITIRIRLANDPNFTTYGYLLSEHTEVVASNCTHSDLNLDVIERNIVILQKK